MALLLKTVFLSLVVAVYYAGHQAEYVCTPCGGDCDSATYHSPGECKGCGMALIEKSKVGFTNLSVTQFCERIANNPTAIILDVRSPAEFDGSATQVSTFGHFAKAINIPINDLENRIDELEPFKDREILVYCSHSRRSPRASYQLGLKGFKNVRNMAGGVSSIPEKKEPCLRQNYLVHEK